MPNNVRYNSMQRTQSNLYSYQQQQQQPHRHHHHHHHHRHNSSPTSQIPNITSYSNLHLNQNSQQITQISNSLASTNQQSSAYFLDRIDLENYTNQTLKQTVENILSKTKSKGLKVKIALPNDGLIIHNVTDPNQSWIFKTSELLYFWRDPYYLNIIVVITTNRSRRYTNRPYSASVFRVRGTDSAQVFLEQARQFFSNLSTVSNNNNGSNIINFNRNKSVESLNRTTEHQSLANSRNRTKQKTLLTNNEKPSSSSSTLKTTSDGYPSPQALSTATATTTPIRRVTRAEFDPGKAITQSNDSNNINTNRRTYSETASSTDSNTINSIKEHLAQTKKLNDDDDDDDDKMTTVSNNFTNEQVAELVRELKELRQEIASLKLSSNNPSIRALSPSIYDGASQSEVDAETQTDFSLVERRRRQSSKKNKKTMIGTGALTSTNKTKTSHKHTRNGRRTYSNSSTNTVSEQEETPSDLSSQMNDSSNDTNSVRIPEQQPQPVIVPAPPRPVLLRNQMNTNFTTPMPYTISHGNPMVSTTSSIEEGLLSSNKSIIAEKEMSKFLSTNNPSSSNMEMIRPSTGKFPPTPPNFRPVLENSNNPTEHIYENIPILIQPNSNREPYYNIPIINADDQSQQPQSSPNSSNGTYAYYPINNNNNNNNNRENDSQQQYPITGQTISNSPPTTDNNNNLSEQQFSVGSIQSQKPQIISAGRHRNQPIYFANHLTNPVFNVDKQLLVNTIANQFGVDLNSPQLQQLLTNQHLFVARKRTFANMIWQLTPDEETALCASPQSNNIDIDIDDSNNTTARSILKVNKRLQVATKRRGISWDSTLE